MPKPLSYETLFAALTVLGTAACSKAAPTVQAEPAPLQVTETTASAAPALTVAPPPVADQDPLAAAPAAPAGSVAPGIEKKPAARAVKKLEEPGNCGAKAACGAGTCSDDMKK